MKIKGTPPSAFPSRLAGTISVHYLSHGRVAFHKWPRKRGEPKHPVTRAQVALWDMVLELVKATIASELSQALTHTKGTAFYAKDILISAAYGNYVSWPGWGWKA